MVDTADNLLRAYTNLRDTYQGFEEGLLPFDMVTAAREVLQDASEAYDLEHQTGFPAYSALASGVAEAKRVR